MPKIKLKITHFARQVFTILKTPSGEMNRKILNNSSKKSENNILKEKSKKYIDKESYDCLKS